MSGIRRFRLIAADGVTEKERLDHALDNHREIGNGSGDDSWSASISVASKCSISSIMQRRNGKACIVRNFRARCGLPWTA